MIRRGGGDEKMIRRALVGREGGTLVLWCVGGEKKGDGNTQNYWEKSMTMLTNTGQWRKRKDKVLDIM